MPQVDESRSDPKRPSLKQRTEALVREMVERGILLEEAKKEFEKVFLAVALEISGQNQSKAAKILGLHRNTLRSKIHLCGLDSKR